MQKKIAIMVITLGKESIKEPNKEIEDEILKELRELRLDYMEKVDKVTVLGSYEDQNEVLEA